MHAFIGLNGEFVEKCRILLCKNNKNRIVFM